MKPITDYAINKYNLASHILINVNIYRYNNYIPKNCNPQQPTLMYPQHTNRTVWYTTGIGSI